MPDGGTPVGGPSEPGGRGPGGPADGGPRRFVVLGLAGVGSAWSGDLTRWAAASALPLEFVKCVSARELRGRLASGRPHSAVIIDGRSPELDRDLVAEARHRGCAVVVITDGRVHRDWDAVGVSAVLDEPVTREAVWAVLAEHAHPIAAALPPTDGGPPAPPPWRGRLIAVTGAPGTGRSTVAASLAAALGRRPAAAPVLLVDLCLRAHQALLHGTGDVVPGLTEVVGAHRTGRPSRSALAAMTWRPDGAGYDLLTGLRNPRDWVALRDRAFRSALANLVGGWRHVVADCDADVQGDHDTGSVDIEDRNRMARVTLAAADGVVIVGRGDMTGVADLLETASALAAFGVPPERTVLAVNPARGGRVGRDVLRAVRQLGRDLDLDPADVVPLPHLRTTEGAARQGLPGRPRLARDLLDPLARASRTPRDPAPAVPAVPVQAAGAAP